MARPRFQFSLRTLLIGVTLFAIPCWYVGRQYQIVRARKAWLAAHPRPRYIIYTRPKTTIPPIRRWLGDAFEPLLYAEPYEMEETKKLFPEADVFPTAH